MTGYDVDPDEYERYLTVLDAQTGGPKCPQPAAARAHAVGGVLMRAGIPPEHVEAIRIRAVTEGDVAMLRDCDGHWRYVLRDEPNLRRLLGDINVNSEDYDIDAETVAEWIRETQDGG